MAKEVDEASRRAVKRLLFCCHLFYGGLVLINVILAFINGTDGFTFITIAICGLMWALVAQSFWRRTH